MASVTGFKATKHGSQIIDITNKVIPNLCLDPTVVMTKIFDVLKKCSPNVCVAGGNPLNSCSTTKLGKNERTDIDFWLTFPEGAQTTAFNDTETILAEYGVKNYNLYHSVLTAGEVQIINTNKTSLEDVIYGFDNASCQIGCRVVDGNPQILCTPEFLKCFETGRIDAWYFDTSDARTLKRLVKYLNKGFYIAPHLYKIARMFSSPHCPHYQGGTNFLSNEYRQYSVSEVRKYSAGFNSKSVSDENHGRNIHSMLGEKLQDTTNYLCDTVVKQFINSSSPEFSVNFGLFNDWKISSSHKKNKFYISAKNKKLDSYIERVVAQTTPFEKKLQHCDSCSCASKCINPNVNYDGDILCLPRTYFVTPTESYENDFSEETYLKLKAMESTHSVRVFGNITWNKESREGQQLNITVDAVLVCFVENALKQ